MRILHLLLVALLTVPINTWAQAAQVAKDPLAYPIKQYAFVLGLSLLGGFVSWINRVRKGESTAASLNALIGELCTSALAGLLAFFLCEWMNSPPLLTAAVAGIAGHMGTRGITLLEEALGAWIKRRSGAA